MGEEQSYILFKLHICPVQLPPCGHFEEHHQLVTCRSDQLLFGHRV